MEPFIKSTLSVAQKVPSRQVSSLTVGVVIHSLVGNIEPTIITSPRQFLDMYTVNNKLTKGDHPSLLNAYFLSRSCDLVVARATTSTDVPMVGINTGNSTEDNTLDPYFIGYRNVGSINTLKAWISDVSFENVDGVVDGFSYFKLNLLDKLNGRLSYKMSDNPEATDVQGNPIYFDWIQDIRKDVIIQKNEAFVGTLESKTEPDAPNVGKSTEFLESVNTNVKLLASASHAANSFSDYENKRIQVYTDAGWYTETIAKTLEAVAAEKKGLACVSTPPEMKDVNQIINYFASFNGFYSIKHANGGKDTSIVGFQVPISASCYFIEAIARNSTRNSTYAPTFSKVNGPITESNLYSNFNKSQRELLSAARVNVLVYDETDGVSYINNNNLSDSSGSLIDEDQSIRIVNDIQFDINKLMESFYSRYNLDGTRSAVVSSINNYFKTNILAQSYTISGFDVVCSEVNNTLTTIQNNELKVDVYIQLNHSIKFITVATNVVPTL